MRTPAGPTGDSARGSAHGRRSYRDGLATGVALGALSMFAAHLLDGLLMRWLGG